MTPHHPAKIYDAISDHYRDYSEKRSKYISSVNQLILKDAQRLGRKLESVFDFGAGDGIRGKDLAHQLEAQTLVQGDISQKMVEKCKVRDEKSHYKLEVYDLSEFDWTKMENRFDLVLCLWNVFGHIPTQPQRIECLIRLNLSLKPGGRILFDVNNRHNKTYGRLKVQLRRVWDALLPNEKRGDASFLWEIAGKKYPAYGHLFTKSEMEEILIKAGLNDYSWKTVDYSTGEVSTSVTSGQLYFNAGMGKDHGKQ